MTTKNIILNNGRSMNDKYSEQIIDHFSNPRNVGEIANADGIGLAGNPICGDVMQISIKVENGIICDAKFKTFGCAAAIASSSMATELIIGKRIEEAKKITNQLVTEALGGMPRHKIHCSVLVEQALKKALEDYYQKL